MAVRTTKKQGRSLSVDTYWRVSFVSSVNYILNGGNPRLVWQEGCREDKCLLSLVQLTLTLTYIIYGIVVFCYNLALPTLKRVRVSVFGGAQQPPTGTPRRKESEQS